MFYINTEEFTKNIMSLYFKHNNYASFLRQLNLYGFIKITRRKNCDVYSNPNFNILNEYNNTINELDSFVIFENI